MKRREFITLLGGAAAAWPLAARAQQSAVPIVGLVSPRSPEDSARLGAAFRKALNETGYIEGQNVMVDAFRPGAQRFSSWARPSRRSLRAFSPASFAANSDLNPPPSNLTPSGFDRL
jgi:hypothetical protein